MCHTRIVEIHFRLINKESHLIYGWEYQPKGVSPVYREISDIILDDTISDNAESFELTLRYEMSMEDNIITLYDLSRANDILIVVSDMFYNMNLRKFKMNLRIIIESLDINYTRDMIIYE